MRYSETINVLSNAAGHWNRWIVAIYKALGFVVLVAILLGLVSYLSLQLFFFTNRRWMAPALVSPTDPKVLQLNTQVAQETLLRDKLWSERQEMLSRLAALDRSIALETAHQQRMRKAIASDLRARRAELAMLQTVAGHARSTKDEIEQANRAYAGMSKGRIRELYQARLIGQDAYLTGHHQLAELELTNLNLSERTVSLVQRVALLRREAAALSGIGKDLGVVRAGREDPLDPPLTYELLGVRRDYDRSSAEMARAQQELGAVRTGLAAIEHALDRHERLLRVLSDSPYSKAGERSLVVAFVPYENLSNAMPGKQLFGCSFGLLACRTVGRVASVLPGEATASHPIRSQELRGVMVELDLFDPTGIEHQVLHSGRAPFLL